MKTRPHGWEESLDAYLHSVLHAEYDLVKFNCAHFILGVVSSVSGKSREEILHAVLPNMPTTSIGVARAIAEHGDMRGFAKLYFGVDMSTALLQARRGDVMLIDGETGDGLGVMTAGGIVALSPHGLITLKLTEARGFWEVNA